jgi:hypothetical protein
MNTTFNFNRLALLLKRYFSENTQREITYWAIVTIVFIFIHNAESVRTFLYISGLIFAARQFNIFNYSPSGMHYLLIPATHTEKLTSAILLSTLYYFIMVVITYIIGNLTGTFLANAIFDQGLAYKFDFIQSSISFPQQFPLVFELLNDNSIFITLGTFAFIQSTFILGSLYFKRNAAIKTMLSGFLFLFGLFILQMILVYYLYGSFSLNNASFVNVTFEPENSFTVDILINLKRYGGYVAMLFFWIVSYFRLTEKQV